MAAMHTLHPTICLLNTRTTHMLQLAHLLHSLSLSHLLHLPHLLHLLLSHTLRIDATHTIHDPPWHTLPRVQSHLLHLLHVHHLLLLLSLLHDHFPQLFFARSTRALLYCLLLLTWDGVAAIFHCGLLHHLREDFSAHLL